MLEIRRYNPEYKYLWDNLVNNSRNGTFLFLRDYMDYHSARFNDCSFIFFKKGEIIAVIAGNIKGDDYFSHQGLTYGGIISSSKVRIIEIEEIFILLNKELKEIGIKEVYYKPVPLIYHMYPSQEDLYFLFKLRARKIECNVASIIFCPPKVEFSKLRRRGIKKGLKAGIMISESDRFDLFWDLLKENLDLKYKTKPIHNLDEISLLNKRFPENIRLFIASEGSQLVAGVVLYIMQKVIRVQYISSNNEGRRAGALDLLFNELLNRIFSDMLYFDMGTSYENGGQSLNRNLIFQKEGFGGRGVVYETYSYKV